MSLVFSMKLRVLFFIKNLIQNTVLDYLKKNSCSFAHTKKFTKNDLRIAVFKLSIFRTSAYVREINKTPQTSKMEHFATIVNGY